MRHKACQLSELPAGQCRVINHERTYITVMRHGEEVYAINDTCPHLGGSLGAGWMTDEGTIVCPWHGWEFRMSDGEGVWPAGIQVETYPVQIEGDDIYVTLDEATESTTET